MTNKTDKNSNQTRSAGAQLHPEQAVRNSNLNFNPYAQIGVKTSSFNSRLADFVFRIAYSNRDLVIPWDGVASLEAIREKMIYKLTRWHDVYARCWRGYAEFLGDTKLKFLRIKQVADAAVNFIIHGPAYDAALCLTNCPAEADLLMENYYGHFPTDEFFAKRLLRDTKLLPKFPPAWLHVDWIATIRDLRNYFVEYSGHYFCSPVIRRNLTELSF